MNEVAKRERYGQRPRVTVLFRRWEKGQKVEKGCLFLLTALTQSNIMSIKIMKELLLALLVTATALSPSSAFAQDGPPSPEGWQYSVGAGVVYTPTYLGDDDSQVSGIPNVRVAYGEDFFASFGEGIGYNLINQNGFKVGPIVKYDFGRDEDGSNLFGAGDDTTDLIGLDDVDGSIEVGAFVEYEVNSITTKLEARQGIGGHEGLVGEASVHYGGAANVYGQQLLYSLGPELKYTDGDYNKAYFGVNAAQSAASGLAQYNADDATLSYGFSGNLIVLHTEHVSTIFFADYTRLGDTIADSSLVTQRGAEDQTRVGFLINYRF